MISVETLIADHQLYHSDFQMDSLITIRAGGTRYGCYKQALRELWKRYRGLGDLYSQIELVKIDIDELSANISETDLTRRRVAVHLARKRLTLRELEKNVGDTEREFVRFYNQAAALKRCIGELSETRRAELDREMWEHRIRAAAAIDFISSGRLGAATIENLCACPSEMRERLATELLDPRRQRKLVEWWLSYSPEIPDIKSIPIRSLRKFIES